MKMYSCFFLKKKRQKIASTILMDLSDIVNVAIFFELLYWRKSCYFFFISLLFFVYSFFFSIQIYDITYLITQ